MRRIASRYCASLSFDAKLVRPEPTVECDDDDERVASLRFPPGTVVLLLIVDVVIVAKSVSSQLVSFACWLRLSQSRRACSCVRGSVLLKNIAESPLPIT